MRIKVIYSFPLLRMPNLPGLIPADGIGPKKKNNNDTIVIWCC